MPIWVILRRGTSELNGHHRLLGDHFSLDGWQSAWSAMPPASDMMLHRVVRADEVIE
jgi:hypothetical protein